MGPCVRRDDSYVLRERVALRRDQIAHGRNVRFVGDQFLAEHAGFFARGFGRKAPQQDQERLGGLASVSQWVSTRSTMRRRSLAAPPSVST